MKRVSSSLDSPSRDLVSSFLVDELCRVIYGIVSIRHCRGCMHCIKQIAVVLLMRSSLIGVPWTALLSLHVMSCEVMSHCPSRDVRWQVGK